MMLRPAQPSDLPRIAALQIDSWRRAYAGLLSDAYLGAPVAQDLTDRWQPAMLHQLAVTVAERDGQIQGFVSVRLGGDGGAYLDNLHVAAQAHRQGLGRALMGAAAASTIGGGDTTLWLTVITENTRARAFYRAMGGVEGPPYTEDLYGNPVEIVAVTWTDPAQLIPPA